MLVNQNFLNSLSPVEIEFIRVGLEKLFREKVNCTTTNYENLSLHVEKCPHCEIGRAHV